jgi:hypothetical protein
MSHPGFQLCSIRQTPRGWLALPGEWGRQAAKALTHPNDQGLEFEPTTADDEASADAAGHHAAKVPRGG